MGSTTPGSSLLITKETELFARLCHLLINGATQMFRMMLDLYHPPPSLPGVLQREKRKLQSLPGGVMNPSIWNKLYPTPASYGTSADLDITALFVLIRNTCGLQPPASTGSWDKAPPITDVSLEADLVRLKQCRNSLYGHITETSITEDEFSKLWGEISYVLIRRGGVQWKTYIDNLLSAPFTVQRQSDVSQLTGWYNLDSDKKAEFQKFEKSLKSDYLDMKAELERLENAAKEIGIGASVLHTSESTRVLDEDTILQKLKDVARDTVDEISGLTCLDEEAIFRNLDNVANTISSLTESVNSLNLDVQRELQRQENARTEILNQLLHLTETVEKIKEDFYKPERFGENTDISEPSCKRPRTGNFLFILFQRHIISIMLNILDRHKIYPAYILVLMEHSRPKNDFLILLDKIHYINFKLSSLNIFFAPKLVA